MSPNSTFASSQRTQLSNQEQFSRSEIFTLLPSTSNLVAMLLTSLGSVLKNKNLLKIRKQDLCWLSCVLPEIVLNYYLRP